MNRNLIGMLGRKLKIWRATKPIQRYLLIGFLVIVFLFIIKLSSHSSGSIETPETQGKDIETEDRKFKKNFDNFLRLQIFKQSPPIFISLWNRISNLFRSQPVDFADYDKRDAVKTVLNRFNC